MIDKTCIWWKSLVRMPRQVGSIMPSSPQLAARMAREVKEFLPSNAGRIVEIGAGTGAITHALTQTTSLHRLTVVEADRGCCVYLRRRFPHLHVIEGLVEERLEALMAPGEPLALVSSVPLFSLTKPQRSRVLAAFETLVSTASRARIVQFTYVPWLPEPRARSLLRERVRAVWRNVPPAWVWSGTHVAV
jgi:phosphatidylethanolamine/phosphatidyl-N-methylethanolamine N-methyltransferase